MGEAEFFKEQAKKCRREAGATDCVDARRGLMQMAKHYDREAVRAAREQVQVPRTRRAY
jgi:hypothetical protein